jgi:hypothetical protein
MISIRPRVPLKKGPKHGGGHWIALIYKIELNVRQADQSNTRSN